MFQAPQTPLRTYPHPTLLSQTKTMEMERGLSFKSRVTKKWPNIITLVTRLKQRRALGLKQNPPQRKHLPPLEPLLKPIKRFSNRGRPRKPIFLRLAKVLNQMRKNYPVLCMFPYSEAHPQVFSLSPRQQQLWLKRKLP